MSSPAPHSCSACAWFDEVEVRCTVPLIGRRVEGFLAAPDLSNVCDSFLEAPHG